MAGELSREDSIAKIAGIIKGIRTAMLTTVDATGCLHSRPMVTQDEEFDGTLWFFTGASTNKAQEIQKDQHVNVAYSDPDSRRFASVAGRAQIVRDPAKNKEFWKPIYKAWFPGGLEDPDLALIRVDVESVEYWDAGTGAVAYVIGLAKALTKGERYEGGPDNHGEVGLK